MNILDFVKIETSKRADGNMSITYGEEKVVDRNRREFWSKNGFKYDNTYLLRTDFEKRDTVGVVNVVPDIFTVYHDTDAIITDNRDIVLALLTADCLQITAFDSKNNVLALIHAGFRWQDAGIIDRTFEVMHERFGTDPKDVLIHLGNCISSEYYRWDENIFKYINKESWIYKTLKKNEGDNIEKPYRIDLREAAMLNLKDLGVLEENVVDSGIDCYSHEDYFSHVRALDTGKKEGRHMTVVQMK